MKIFRKIDLLLLTVPVLLMMFQSAPRADEVLWKSGANLYIKITEQDKFKEGDTPPNQHPVSLSPQKISNALNLIKVWDRKLIKKDELKTAFSPEQARILGQYLAEGLSRAQPDQDIIFSTPRREKKYVVIQNLFYTTGRAFYADGMLNIIIGEFEKPPDRFKERAHQSSGISEVKYFFDHGRRAKKSRFKMSIVGKPGLSNREVNGKVRKDWLVIDVEQASATYLAENAPEEDEEEKAARLEAARLAKERREMRLEMARIRKEMEEANRGGETKSVEERLQMLEELKTKQLITEEEYQKKRREILGDI